MDLLKFGAQKQLLRARKFTLVDQQLDFSLSDPLVRECIDGGQPFLSLRNRRRAVGAQHLISLDHDLRMEQQPLLFDLRIGPPRACIVAFCSQQPGEHCLGDTCLRR
jgi:hypothetical protein